jgi:hypothetical protein
VRRDRRKLRNEELHNLYSPLLLGWSNEEGEAGQSM